MSLRHFGSACLLGAASLASNVARAESPSEQSLTQADTHFKQGVQLFKRGAFEGALVEFRKAHQLVPDFRVQFNIGRSCVELRDAACALVAYRSYLASADQVAPERVLEVQAEVARLEPLVGSVRIGTSADGAALSLDDVEVGPAPLPSPILVNPGRHRVSARFSDGTTATRVIEVASGEEKQVALAPEGKPDGPRVGPPSASSTPTAIATLAPARDREPSKVWIGWVASGVLAAAAGTTGALALSARSQAKHDAGRADGGAALDSSNERTHALAAVTDVLLAATAATAGITLYFAVKSPAPRSSAPPRVSVALTPRAVELGYRF